MTRSPIQPQVPDLATGPIDWAHLARATLGDAELSSEVLTLFATQAEALAAAIQGLPPDASALAHKLKGSAQGIGAWAVADAAEAVETALAAAADPAPAVAALLTSVALAREAIDTRSLGVSGAGAAHLDSL